MSFIYAVQMQIPDYSYAPIKIGYSVEPERRIKEFTRAPFPLVWLGQWPAPNGRRDESEAHQALAKFRLCGEWFYPSSEVIQFVERNLGTDISTASAGQLSPKKAQAFNSRLAEMFPEPPAPTRSAPIPDPFDFPFEIPYAAQVKKRMSRILEQWPVACGGYAMVKKADIPELPGLPVSAVKLFPVYWRVANTVRYSPKHVEAFLEMYPSYLKAA